MTKKIFKNQDFESLIEEHNPFAIKSLDGQIQLFDDYAEVYLYVLRVLYSQFERGYVDIILLVNILTGMRVGECEDLFRQIKPLWGPQPERLMSYDWDMGAAHNTDLQDVMKSLHVITETNFKMYEFEKAFEKFRLELVKNQQL